MSKNKRRGHKSKAQDITGEQSKSENGITHLEASSNKQNCSDGISTAEDTLIQPATRSCQNSLLEEESPANLLTLKPQDLALNPIENPLEENMLGKKKKKKKRSKNICTKAVTNLEVVPPEAEACAPWLPSEHQELHMNIEANISNRKQEMKKSEVNIPTSGDVDANTTALRPLALEVESTANLLSLNGQESVLNAMGNRSEENMSGKKKGKKSKKNCTEAMISPEVVPSKEATSVRFPAPEFQEDMNNEVSTSIGKQEKRKKSILNIPTCDAVGVDTTAQQPPLHEVESAAVFLSPKPQDIDLNPMEKNLEKNMSGKKKKKKRSGKISTDAEVVPPEAEDSLQLPAPGLQDLDAVGVNATAQQPLLLEIESAAGLLSPKPQDIDSNPMENNLEENMSGKKKRKKKRSGKLSTKFIPNVEVVPPEAEDSLQLPSPGFQDLDMMIEANTSNRIHMGKKSNLNLPPGDVDVDTSFAQQPLACEVESAANLFSPKLQDTVLNPMGSNLEENMPGKKKKKKKKSEKISTEANPNLEVVPPKTEDSVQFPASEFQDPNMTIDVNTSNRKHKGKKSNLNLPACDVVGVGTTFPQQPLACEVETAANLLSPKPHDVVLNAMENHLEGDICGEKTCKKKKKSETIPTRDIPNLVLSPQSEGYEQLPARELQGIDVKIETNSTNRKQEKRKKNKVNRPTVDAADVNMTSHPQPLAPEVESTESLLSLEPQEVVLNPMKENMAEKKKKRSENTSTEVMPNLGVVPSEAVACVQLPVTELQQLDVHIVANSSHRKQKKRKKSKVDTPTGDPVDVDATAPQPLALVVESTANLLSPMTPEVVFDPKNNKVNKPMIGAADVNMTSSPQPLEPEVESTENLLSLEPQDVVLIPMKENMAEKKKKRSENTSTEVIPNLEVVPSEAVAHVQLPVSELQELDVNIEANSSNRKQKKRKKSKVNTPTGDDVDVDATAPQALALVIESTANLLSPKPHDVVLDPKNNKVNKPTIDAADVNMTSLEPQDTVLIPMEENIAEKKKKRGENTSTEVIPNLDVVPSEAVAHVQLPVTELQELDVNIEANSSNRKQKKRKKSKVNAPTCVAIDADATVPQPLALVVESTANLLSPRPQDVVLDPMDNCMEERMAGKNKEKSENIPTEAISNLEVVPHKTKGSVQLPAQECQELDVNIEANSSNKNQKKRKKNKVNKPTSNAVEVDTTSAPQSHAPEHQERVTNVTREVEEKSSSEIKCSNGEGKKNQHKPTSDAVDVTSAHQPLPLELQEMDRNLTKDLDVQSGSGQNGSSEKRKRKKKKKKNLTSNVIDTNTTGEVLVVTDNLERDALSLIDIEVNNDNGRKRKIGATDIELAAQVMEHENRDLTNKTKRRNVTKGEVEEVDNVKSKEIDTLCAHTIKMSSEDVNVVSLLTNSALDVEKSAMSCENGLHLAFPEKNTVAESCIEGTSPSSSTVVTMDVNPCLRRKLLILDLNGLLADIIMPPPKGFKPDASFMRRAVFKRPFCDDFLKFCFERFDLAIWSSRSKRIIDRVIDYLFGDLKHELLFCWDMSHATMTKFKTLENKDKPLVCKDLRNIWETRYPGLPWKKGDYDESNTLLLDDSPYKALLNPAHTTIFPHSYNFMDKDKDNSLGPGGDLRVYLEKLADAEHVQKFVEQHPFGQRAICEKHPSWGFYSKVMMSLSPQHSF